MTPPTSEIPRTGMLLHLPQARWEAFRDLPRETRRVPARETLVRKGEPVRESLLLLNGVMGRYIARPGEERSQMVALQVAGDFVDLHGFPLGALDHEVRAVTDVMVAAYDHGDLYEMVARAPDLATDLWRLTLIDAAIHRHWAFRMGAMRALARLADYICEMDVRLHFAGEVEGDGFDLPLTQADLADACGMTAVHVNRVLRDLREDGCCTMRDGRVTIHDRARLRGRCDFDPTFLFVAEDGAGYRSTARTDTDR